MATFLQDLAKWLQHHEFSGAKSIETSITVVSILRNYHLCVFDRSPDKGFPSPGKENEDNLGCQEAMAVVGTRTIG